MNFHTAHDGLHVHAHLYLTAILTAEQTLAQLLCLALLAEAYALPALIDDWFTEDFDTADLQEAKGLLEDLACTVTSPGIMKRAERMLVVWQ